MNPPTRPARQCELDPRRLSITTRCFASVVIPGGRSQGTREQMVSFTTSASMLAGNDFSQLVVCLPTQVAASSGAIQRVQDGEVKPMDECGAGDPPEWVIGA